MMGRRSCTTGSVTFAKHVIAQGDARGSTMINDESASITVVMPASMARCSAGGYALVFCACVGVCCARTCCHGPCCPAGLPPDVVYINAAIVLVVDTGALWASPAVLQEVCSAASIELQELRVRWTRCSASCSTSRRRKLGTCSTWVGDAEGQDKSC